MSTLQHQRRQRQEPPHKGDEGTKTELKSPPKVPQDESGMFAKLMPLMMVGMAIGMITMGVLSSGSGGPNYMMLMMGGMMLLMGIAFAAQSFAGGGATVKLAQQRWNWRMYLAKVREEVDFKGAQQLERQLFSFPNPESLDSMIGSRRMWERRPGGESDKTDFSQVRVGIANRTERDHKIEPEQTISLHELDPLISTQTQAFVASRTHLVDAIPHAVRLKQYPSIGISGDLERARKLVNAMVMQFAMFHGPDDAAIVVITPRPDESAWNWIKWLPQNLHASQSDALGPTRMFYPSTQAFLDAWKSDTQHRGAFTTDAAVHPGQRYLLVVVDDGVGIEPWRDGKANCTFLVINPDSNSTADNNGLRYEIDDEAQVAEIIPFTEERQPVFVADQADFLAAFNFSRRLSGRSLSTGTDVLKGVLQTAAAPKTILELLDIDDPENVDIEEIWSRLTPKTRMQAYFGYRISDGTPIMIDLKEDDEGGSGPHGGMIGKTGSGKSEVIKSMLTYLLMTHSPEELNIVGSDFKGNATFDGFEGVPHFAAILTNMDEEKHLVDRLDDAIRSEIERRQTIIRTYGFGDILKTNRASRAGVVSPKTGTVPPYTPALLFLADEYGKTLRERPEIATLFYDVGTVGRSLAMHLLLANQKLDIGRIQGIETHLSYYFALRANRPEDSREAIGSPDAYHIPKQQIGRGYYKSGPDEPLDQFQSFYVSAPYTGMDQIREAAPARVQTGYRRPHPFTIAPVLLDEDDALDVEAEDVTAEVVEESETDPLGAPTLLSVLMRNVVGNLRHGRAHEVWLPVFGAPIALDQMIQKHPTIGQQAIDAAAKAAEIGLTRELGPFAVTLAEVDNPRKQRRDPLQVNLLQGSGNIGLVGGGKKGVSSVITSFVLGLASQNRPDVLQFYLVDMGGMKLRALSGLPHVGTVATQGQTRQIKRTIAEMEALVASRALLFEQHEVAGIEDFRKRKAAGEFSEDQDRNAPDVVLVIDGYETMIQEVDAVLTLNSYSNRIAALLDAGPRFGLHIFMSVSVMTTMLRISQHFSTQLELKQAADAQSICRDAKRVALIPNKPGFGITVEGNVTQFALPRLDGVGSPDDLFTGPVQDSCAMVAQKFEGIPGAPKVRSLPSEVDAASIRQRLTSDGVELKPMDIPLGLWEDSGDPVVLDLEEGSHLLALGDKQCGKSNLIELIADSLMASRPEGADYKFVFFDPDGRLRQLAVRALEAGCLTEKAYVTTIEAAAEMWFGLNGYYMKRAAGRGLLSDIDRTAWESPEELFIFVDGFEQFAGIDAALTQSLVTQGSNIGVHIIATNPSAGAMRYTFSQSLLSQLKNRRSPALQMSGSKDDGNLLPNVTPDVLPPGRGVLVLQGRKPALIQVGLHPSYRP